MGTQPLTIEPARCSDLARTLACPGWRVAAATFPKPKLPEKENAMRDSGTKVHEAIECIIDGKPVEMTLSRQEEYVMEKCIAMGHAFSSQVFGVGGKPLRQWQRVRLEWRDADTEDLILSGTPDFFATDENGTWLISDNKRGPKPVQPASLNWQIVGYACLLFKNAEFKAQWPFDEIHGAIFQPLCSDEYKPVRLTSRDMLKLCRRVEDAIAHSAMPDAHRTPGPHCEYCPARHACPEAQAITPILAQRLSGIERIQHLTPGELLAFKPRVDEAKKMIDAFDDAFRSAVHEKQIDGYETYDHPAGHDVDDPSTLLNLVKPWLSSKEFRMMLKCPVASVRDLTCSRMADRTGVRQKEAMSWWNNHVVPHLTPKPTQLRIRKVKNDSAKKVAAGENG